MILIISKVPEFFELHHISNVGKPLFIKSTFRLTRKEYFSNIDH